MSKIIIIGYGNHLRGDDGLGPYAAECLEESGLNDNVEIYAPHQLAPELAQPISEADFVIFIDACWGEESGKVSCLEIAPDSSPPRAATSSPGSFSHHLTPAVLMAMAARLYGSRPRALVVSVCSRSFAFGEGLSLPVKKVLPELLRRVWESIELEEVRSNA